MHIYRSVRKTVGFAHKYIKFLLSKPVSKGQAVDEKTAWGHIGEIRPHDYANVAISTGLKETEKEITVIIPVYNTEAYLDACVQSVMEATEGLDAEILLIDDGAADNSGKMCDEYSRKYPGKVRTIHKENGGLSDARNCGIGQAWGRYLLFVDSDDLLLDVKTLYETACRENADVVEGNFVIFDNGTMPDPSQKHLKERKNIGAADISNGYTPISRCAGFAWGKLYKKEYWNELLFPKGFVFEDTVTETFILRKAKRYCFVDKACYGYRRNLQSICYTVNKDARCLDSVLVYKYWQENLPENLKDDVFGRLMVRQFGAKSFSRIKNVPEYDLRCILRIMKSMLEAHGKIHGLNVYDRMLVKAIRTQDLEKWKFISTYYSG